MNSGYAPIPGHSALPTPRPVPLVLVAACTASAALVPVDARWGADLPIELLYLPSLLVLAWHGRARLAFVVALLVAVAPAVLAAAGLPSGREMAAAEIAFRLFGFVAIAYAGERAHGRWLGLLDRSHEDSLTGLLHHGAFADAAARELARQRRSGGAVSVLSLDIDGFKQLNDTRGHAFGDRVLVGVAGRLRASVRAGDIVGRTGGDEFAVLINGDANAIAVAREHVRAVLANWAAAERLPIGFSLGVATSEAAGPLQATALVERADADMYREKASHHAATGVHAPHSWPAARPDAGMPQRR